MKGRAVVIPVLLCFLACGREPDSGKAPDRATREAPASTPAPRRDEDSVSKLGGFRRLAGPAPHGDLKAALDLLESGRWEEGRARLIPLVTNPGPDRTDALLLLGASYLAEGRNAPAAGAFSRALALSPRDPRCQEACDTALAATRGQSAPGEGSR